MQFYATLVSLYRPYLSSHFVRRGHALASPQDQATISDAAVGCVSAAHQVAETLRCYQRQHSLRRSNVQIVHIIFTASLVFIHDACTQDHLEARSSRNDLQFCCHALGEIGHAYGNATRALEVVILVKSEWQRLASADKIRYESLKRPNGSITASDSRGADLDNGNGSHNKRRSRASFSGLGYEEQPTFLRPPSFSAVQRSCDDYAGQSTGMGMPAIGEAAHDAWHMLGGGIPGLDELMEPMGWLDSQQLQPQLILGEDDLNEAGGVSLQTISGGDKEAEG